MSKLNLFLTILFALIALSLLAPTRAIDQDDAARETLKVDLDMKGPKVPLQTDSEVVQRENEAIKSEGFSVAEQQFIEEQSEKFKFQAEVNKLMNIIINSLYSKKEIFLRELISNASDALDKIRFLALTNPSLLGEGDQANLDIRIMIDKVNKYIHIIDRGVGMTKDELVKNLGTIAQSGTKEFIKKVTESNDPKNSSNLIGQFGVGFYSLFLVADNVIVTSKSNEDDQYIWTSTSENEFSIVKDPKGNTLGRGTKISMHIKDDSLEFLNQDTIKSLVKKYSQFINFPISMYVSHQEDAPEEETPIDAKPVDETEVKVEEEETTDEQEEEKSLIDDAPKPAEKKKIDVFDWEIVNDHKPLWVRSPKEITEEEYNEFYKTLSKGTENPLAHSHFVTEGDTEFRSIIYIPNTPPANLFDPEAIIDGLKLFVRRVFITDSMKDLVPSWLRFLQGIIDSDDLPLNVSREILQQHKILKKIKDTLVKKFIKLVQDLSNNEDKTVYQNFYKKYGNNLKFGVIEETSNTHNKNRLIKLLMFPSSKDEFTTFENYVSRMKEGQEQIYFISGKSKETLKSSPLIEQALKRGYEVIYMVDPIDEYLIPQITTYNNKKLTNLAREGVKFEDAVADEEQEKQVAEEYKPLTDFLQKQLGKKVEKVVISKILADSPCVLVTNQWGVTANMERIMKAQSFGNAQEDNYMAMMNKKIMEINPDHTLIKQLLSRLNEFGADDEVAKVSAQVLFETSSLSSGYIVENPSNFANWIYKMMEVSGEKIKEASFKVEEEEQQQAQEPEVEMYDEPEEDVLDVTIDENNNMDIPAASIKGHDEL
ncbi:heat shock protein Hsp90 family protein [Heterostelium album PN500]|uniref:Heat shock protein Hsp90 family protein n=1 Tax=Heterostelium pallidum (strain ATCC 26659 / Pp 5 / PN500) TaxID=670386 RepID=D3BK59_HETP5|nr:heat shock protein Hsp90 family protein [Heterostelium album PN500]EFA78289.1 heat shock protein Hsp90 family protein [Heterostelium album PN500]|eukprot:XP_020430414.1 heat shock protein Hsp90 family protein [Heterostelium album PN500]